MLSPRAAVLGAGLQGLSTALALEARGVEVDLIDRMPEPMLGTSLRNEGKIHLGFVYGNDPSLRTARLMAESAFAFAPLLDGWLPGAFDWPALRSRPFTYLVLTDSLLRPDDLFAHYERVEEAVAELAGPGTHYLGSRPRRLWREATVPAFVSTDRVAAAAETREVSVDLEAFRERLLAGVGTRAIRFLPGRRIREVTRRSQGFEIRGDTGYGGGGSPWAVRADLVVNCLWDGRLEIDAQMGRRPTRPWAYRLKYRVLAELPESLRGLPSLTLVLGPFGDLVPFPGSTYISWYPVCRRDVSPELRPPAAWNGAGPAGGDRAVELEVAHGTLREMGRIVPGLEESRTRSVDAGIVFSWGRTDIDRLDSEFHERFDIGVWQDDGYFSIDTGKLTCAPLFADRMARSL